MSGTHAMSAHSPRNAQRSPPAWQKVASQALNSSGAVQWMKACSGLFPLFLLLPLLLPQLLQREASRGAVPVVSARPPILHLGNRIGMLYEERRVHGVRPAPPPAPLQCDNSYCRQHCHHRSCTNGHYSNAGCLVASVGLSLHFVLLPLHCTVFLVVLETGLELPRHGAGHLLLGLNHGRSCLADWAVGMHATSLLCVVAIVPCACALPRSGDCEVLRPASFHQHSA
mmetsp:Transcript_13706/g.38794  ORF Transcript_13706/g.38794 Transcript_13706/m.38794 type:complete len:227 (+) Transcript_13706:110-790(+)